MLNISGYAGNILYIDLSEGKIRKEPLDPQMAKDFIGGYGINNKLALELIPSSSFPFSSENSIIIGAGPFAGTFVPGASKIVVTTKFPLNSAVATAHGGGAFAFMLKTSGYDHVVIRGRAPKPSYLKITDDAIELFDAKDLWGKDSFETTDELRRKYEPCSVITMGQAGENLVKISVAHVDKYATIGTGGLPAVMGSKNLKAIVACQGSKKITIAHRLKFQKLVDGLIQRVMTWPGRQMLLEHGMTAALLEWWAGGGRPIKNLTEVAPDLPDIAQVLHIHKKTFKPLACPSCPLADKEVNRVNEGLYAGMVTYMPHFLLYQFLGGNIVDQFYWSMKFTDALNKHGICMFDFSYLLSLLSYLYSQGIITQKDTGGIVIKEDFPTSLRLLEMTACRQEFGDILAGGILEVCERIGKDIKKYAHHIKGRSLLFDPRLNGLGTMEFEPLIAHRGSHVGAAGSPSYTPGRPPEDFARHCERMGVPDEAIKRIVGQTAFNPGRLSKWSEDWYALFGCLSLCNRAFVNRFYHIETITALYSALTGLEFTPNKLMRAAERSWNVAKLINVRAGFNRKDDKPPPIWFSPLKAKEKEYFLTDYYKTQNLSREDIEHFLDDYYDERGWDKVKGIPTKEKLKELGLEVNLL